MRFLTMLMILSFFIACNNSTREENREQQETTESGRVPEVSLEPVWSTDSVFNVPESVCYDPERNTIYVSNIVGDPAEKDGNGFISKLSPDGEVLELKWIDGLHAPKGMGIVKNFLYVADITDVAVININDGNVVEMYQIPEAEFLNDISVGPDGLVYVSDSRTSKIHKIGSGLTQIFMGDSLLNGPNGLYCEEEIMMLASSGDEQLKRIRMDTKDISVLADGIGHGDGIARDHRGNYVVSNWAGQIFYITPAGNSTLLLDTREKKINSADVDLMVDDDLLLVPTFHDNRVMAYKLSFE